MSGSSSHGAIRVHKREHDDRAVRNGLMKTAVQTEAENVTLKFMFISRTVLWNVTSCTIETSFAEYPALREFRKREFYYCHYAVSCCYSNEVSNESPLRERKLCSRSCMCMFQCAVSILRLLIIF